MSVIEKEGLWSLGEIQKLFKLKDKVKSRQTLFNAEERGEIPTSIRVSRGKTAVRMWSTQQLPKIGERYGFLQKPKGQEVLCIYTAKGGVLKTTLAYSLGRALALNGIKTIIIGLDIQCSVTEILLSRPELSALEDYNDSEYYGLYQFLYGKVPFKKIIKSTDLPTLDIIPELPDLNLLEKKLRLENRREYVFRDKILPKLKDYDVVIFDNGPSWNQLIESALTASDHVISPAGCDVGTYQALKTNLGSLWDFSKTMQLEWKNFILVPTLLENTKLSQQVYGAYLNEYNKLILPTPIRRGVKGQEAVILKKSTIESDPGSSISEDYHLLLRALWSRILGR